MSDKNFNESDIRPKDLMKNQAERLQNDINRLLTHKNDFVHVHCPACDQDRPEEKFKKFEISFVECGRCGTLYASPRPRPEHLEDYYANSENYAYWNEFIFPASEEVRRNKIFKPRLQLTMDICYKYEVPTATLVEVGAGFGLYCEEAVKTKAFERVIAIEPTPELAETCRRRGLEVIEAPIEKVSLDVRPDVIVNFEVIEHLFAPIDFLLKCKKLLRPGGILILTCPNVRGFDIMTLGVKSDALDNEHINMFHTDSIQMLLQRAGFETLEVRTPGKLDADIVRNKILAGEISGEVNSFLEYLLIDKWTDSGESFQNFLSSNLLSSNMMIVAQA